MNIFEKKIDVCLRWILANNEDQRNALALEAASLLQETSKSTAPGELEDRIEDLLREFGASHALLGFNYIVYSVTLVLNDWSYLNGVTTRLYPAVAERFDTTANRAERAIRHVVERAFDCGEPDALIKVFGNGVSKFNGKVTNSEFIAGCAREISRRMRNSAVL